MDTGSKDLSVVEAIERRVRDDIINGRLVSGEQLFEVDMARAYGVSRNTIREVSHILVRDGLASFIRYRGVFVRTFSLEDLRDIYAARRAMQLYPLQAAISLPDELLAQMHETIEQARAEVALEHWHLVGSLSLRFHRLQVSSLGCSLIDDLFLNISAQLRLIFTLPPDESAVQKPYWIEWEHEIHELLKQKRLQEAASKLASYLDESERVLSQVVRKWARPPGSRLAIEATRDEQPTMTEE